MSFKSSKPVLLGLVVSFVIASTARANQSPDIAEFPGGKEEALGYGYFKDEERALNSKCLNGEAIIPNPGNTSEDIRLTTSYDFNNVKRNISVKIDGEVSIAKKLSASGAMEFVKNITETDTSYSSVFEYSLNSAQQKFEIPNTASGRLNSLGVSELNKSLYDFYSMCGAHYVSHVDRGGRLYVAVRMDFSSKSAKEAFKNSASIDFMSIAKMKSTIEKTKETYSDKVNIYISAHKIGGKEATLGDVLKISNNGALEACYKPQVKKNNCGTILDRLAEYVSSNGVLARDWSANPAVLGIHTTPYSEVISGINKYDSEVTPDIKNSRAILAKELDEQQALLAEIESVKRRPLTALLEKRWTNVKSAYLAEEQKVLGNIANIKTAMSKCYSEEKSICKSAQINTIANMAPVDLPESPYEIFPLKVAKVGKKGAELTCRIPELSVIVGVGARVSNDNVKGIKVGYRTLLESGELGEIEFELCGSGAEKYVEAPDGNVVTGFAFSARNENVSEIQIISKEWDPEQRRLVGPKEYTSIGRGFEAQLDLSTYEVDTNPLNTDNAVLISIGLSVNDDNASVIEANVGYIE